jgi:large subunit ribosomal protein L24
MCAAKIKKGDQIIVLTGKDKGKKGAVLRINPSENTALVASINVAKKHQRATQLSAGGIIDKEMPIALSNIAILDPKLNKPCRIGFKVLEDGSKVRVSKLSGEVIDQ